MALSSGVYSLIGVAVGAASTGGFQYALAWRADRLDERVARRQVRAELFLRLASLEYLVRASDVLPGRTHEEANAESARRLETCRADLRLATMYERHSDILARHLPGEAWAQVNRAYALCRVLSHMATGDRLAETARQVRGAVSDAAGSLR